MSDSVQNPAMRWIRLAHRGGQVFIFLVLVFIQEADFLPLLAGGLLALTTVLQVQGTWQNNRDVSYIFVSTNWTLITSLFWFASQQDEAAGIFIIAFWVFVAIGILLLFQIIYDFFITRGNRIEVSVIALMVAAIIPFAMYWRSLDIEVLPISLLRFGLIVAAYFLVTWFIGRFIPKGSGKSWYKNAVWIIAVIVALGIAFSSDYTASADLVFLFLLLSVIVDSVLLGIERAFLSPAIIVLITLSIFPLIWALVISFTDSQRGGSTTFVEARSACLAETRTDDEGNEVNNTREDCEDIRSGFLGLNFSLTGDQYGRILNLDLDGDGEGDGDARLYRAIGATLIYVFYGVIIQYVIGFALALLLSQKFFGRNIVRVIFLMPMMMTPVAVAYTGRMLFSASKTPMADLLDFLNETLSNIGSFLSQNPVEINIVIPWLTRPGWASMTLVIMDSWQWIPFVTLLILAGLQAIPDDIYEAARVDGANAFQTFVRITFPIMLPISATVVLIRALETFKIVDIIIITTGGGSRTESLTQYVAETALEFGNYGYAAAMSFILLISVVIFATVYLGLFRRVIQIENY